MNKRTWVFLAIMVGIISGGLFYRHFAQDLDSRGATRLMRAIEENDTQKTAKLLTAEEVNVRDKSGQTALFYAARYTTDPKIIYQLILAGADPLATDNAGNTALVTAAKYNPAANVILTLAKQKHQDPQHQSNKDKALIQAAKYNTAQVIRTLLAAHANPVGHAHQRAADYLVDNEMLTEQEKNDYRQVMLTLEILEEREQFAKSMRTHSHAAKKVIKTSSGKDVAQAGGNTGPVPQEKQMIDEEAN